jgi:hypothetical protein
MSESTTTTEAALPPTTTTTTTTTTTSPPFPVDVHLKTAVPTSVEERTALVDLRDALEQGKSEHYVYNRAWCTDAQLVRFLVARNYKVDKALALTLSACEWRAKRKPGEIETHAGWEEEMKTEAATGKIYVPGFDKWDRPVIIFDNTVQNTTDENAHIRFLAWSLELGTRMMGPDVDKYVIFINLKEFSLRNNPSLQVKTRPTLTGCVSQHFRRNFPPGVTFGCRPVPPARVCVRYIVCPQTTKETIKMLCDCFPERLGHLICYQPPWIFKGVFEAVKSFIDPKTVSKVHFLVGDDADGTENDTTMRTVVGDHWRTLTGAGQPVLVPGNSPGFDIGKYWPDVMARVKALQAKEGAGAAVAPIEHVFTALTLDAAGAPKEAHT